MASNSTNLSGGLQGAGDVEITELLLIGNDGVEHDIRQFLLELNLYEDMFRPGLYGNMMMVDALNLSRLVPLRGDEYVRIKIRTPTTSQYFFKTFRVYAITDGRFLQDSSKQTYVLQFCSSEIIVDAVSPIYRSFSGKISDVVQQIYLDSLQTSRNGLPNDENSLTIIGETENRIKYVSPGWTPLQNISWLAARSLCEGYLAPNYVFFESNKGYYYANIETIIDGAIQSKSIFAQYIYMAQNVSAPQEENQTGSDYYKDVNREFQKIESLEIVSSPNALRSIENGHFANRLINFDIIKKDYVVYDYDHVASYGDYRHLENIGGTSNDVCNPSRLGTIRGPGSFVNMYPKAPLLYNDAQANVSEIVERILPRRISTMNELSTIKLVLTVPGRSDAEVGNIIYLKYPQARPRDAGDSSLNLDDPMYSGFYLVTAIHHKFNHLKHVMIMEVCKDSVQKTKGWNN